VWDGQRDRQTKRKRDDDSIRRLFLFTTSYKLVAYDSRGCPAFCAHGMTLNVSSVFCDTFCNYGSKGNNPHILNLDTSQR